MQLWQKRWEIQVIQTPGGRWKRTFWVWKNKEDKRTGQVVWWNMSRVHTEYWAHMARRWCCNSPWQQTGYNTSSNKQQQCGNKHKRKTKWQTQYRVQFWKLSPVSSHFNKHLAHWSVCNSMKNPRLLWYLLPHTANRTTICQCTCRSIMIAYTGGCTPTQRNWQPNAHPHWHQWDYVA